MAHELGLDASGLVEIDLEGQDDQAQLHILSKQLGPPASPGPDLRGHVVDHPQAPPAGVAGEPEVKLRAVYAYDHIVTIGDQAGRDVPVSPVEG